MVPKSKTALWIAECKNSTEQHTCPWQIHARKKKSHGLWQITRWHREHICLVQTIDGHHRNMSAKFMAKHILTMIHRRLEITIREINSYIYNVLHFNPSY
jgi:hypothetical protein